MERRDSWSALGTGALALGGIGLTVVGLMAEAQPLVYWSMIAVLAVCFVFGGVILYQLNRHRFFGAWVGRDFRVIAEGALPADEKGLLGWYVWLEVVRPVPSVLRVVADRTIYRTTGRYLRDRKTIGGMGGKQSRSQNVGLMLFSAGRFEPGEMLEVRVRSNEAPRIVTIRREPMAVDSD